VGSEACQDCHEDKFKDWDKNPHHRAAQDAALVSESGQSGCESCHGPASLHVAAGGDKDDPGFATIRSYTSMKPEEADAACLQCHKGGEHFFWAHSDHATNGVACGTCHSVHDSKSGPTGPLLRKASTVELCTQCHSMKKAHMARTAHMPLREGLMDCADCHNPHGSDGPHNIRAASTNELCTTCHADKRGPMLWEHPPVREDCLNCHEAHGANNDRSLQARVPFLCQRCHVATRHPSTLYDGPDLQSNRLFNRSCLNCHSQVHGSNHPSGKTLTR
jgi:DmsE family decaheme c-type cytochrome